MPDKRSKLQIKMAALKRYTMWHLLSQRLQLICVTEYPKCGASWLCLILSDYLEVPFPRNVPPKLRRSIMHGHFFPTEKFNQQVCFVRDGRDVVVSFYHHLLIGNNKMSIYSVPRFRKLLPLDDYHNVKENLPRFIEFVFSSPPVFPRFTWKTFCEEMIQKDFFYVTYEDMLKDVVTTSAKVIQYLEPNAAIDYKRLEAICNRYSFKSQSAKEKIKEGESSYLRKGVAGDWKNYFNQEARELFDHFAGDMIIQLGYEANHSWANKKKDLNATD